MDLRRRDGFALIAVLWILVCLGAIALELHLVGSADRQVAMNARAAARARWAARSGLATSLDALDRLLASDSAVQTLAAAGDTVLPPLRLEHEGVVLTAAILDARARVHLNRAEAGELRRLFVARGLGAEAEGLALTVVEWRSGRVPSGSRAPSGEAESLPGVASVPGAFDGVPRLRQVPGFSAAVYGLVAPYLTTVGDGRVNVNSAPVPVLSTLPGMDEEAARAIVARRERLPFANLFEVMDALPRHARERVQAEMASLTERMVFGPRELEITVVAQPKGSAVTARLRATTVLDGGTRVTLRQLVEP